MIKNHIIVNFGEAEKFTDELIKLTNALLNGNKKYCMAGCFLVQQ